MLYRKYFSSYKARYQEKQHISFVRIPTAINITRIWLYDHNLQIF